MKLSSCFFSCLLPGYLGIWVFAMLLVNMYAGIDATVVGWVFMAAATAGEYTDRETVTLHCNWPDQPLIATRVDHFMEQKKVDLAVSSEGQ